MPKVIQWKEECVNRRCGHKFYVHIKQENIPVEPLVTLTCPHCGDTRTCGISVETPLEVNYAS